MTAGLVGGAKNRRDMMAVSWEEMGCRRGLRRFKRKWVMNFANHEGG
jgi:hypothetical protein